jgi:hypothetical protein
MTSYMDRAFCGFEHTPSHCLVGRYYFSMQRILAQDVKRKLNGQRPCEGKPVVVNHIHDRCASTLPISR